MIVFIYLDIDHDLTLDDWIVSLSTQLTNKHSCPTQLLSWLHLLHLYYNMINKHLFGYTYLKRSFSCVDLYYIFWVCCKYISWWNQPFLVLMLMYHWLTSYLGNVLTICIYTSLTLYINIMLCHHINKMWCHHCDIIWCHHICWPQMPKPNTEIISAEIWQYCWQHTLITSYILII